MKNFIKEYFSIIVLVIILLLFFKSCNDSNQITNIKNNIKSLKDSTYTKNELNLRLKIEGLNSERRMIQATDRKILDVNRQTEIDNEIIKLESQIKK